MAIIDRIQIHEERKTEGGSIVERSESNVIFKGKVYNPEESSSLQVITDLSCTEADFQIEYDRLKQQVTDFEGFCTENDINLV